MTRYYLPSSGPADVSPDFAAWDNVAFADRVRMVTDRTDSAVASATVLDQVDPPGTKFLWRQYVSDPLGAQTIAGTVKGQVRTRLQTGDARHNQVNLCIKVVSHSGSVLRGTLLALGAHVSPNMYTPTIFRNRKAADGDTLASVVVVNGDRLVVEIGTSASIVSVDVDGVDASFGDNSATDLPEDETTTAANNPWIEFSQDIVAFTVPRRRRLGWYTLERIAFAFRAGRKGGVFPS